MNRFFNWEVDSPRPSAPVAALHSAPISPPSSASYAASDQTAESPVATAPDEVAPGRSQPHVAARLSLYVSSHASTYVTAQRDRLSVLRASVPEAPVQAVADYSVGYGKQVFFSMYLAARKWHADDASAMAASVAYYLALSLFPMLLLLTAGLGLVFQFTRLGHDAEMQILSVVAEHCSPTLEQQVREVLAQLREQAVVGGPFGLFTAALAAIGVFYRFERSFDRIWRSPPAMDANWQAACVRILTQRLSAFCLLTSVGLCVIAILLANVAVGFVHAWMTRWHLPGAGAISAVDACATLLLNAVVFGLLYRLLPKRRIRWVDALRGGLLAALVWEGGRQLLGAVLIGVRYTAAYGAIGSFIALLLWCYWGVSIVFFGAEYAQVLSDERQKGHELAATDDPAPAEADAAVAPCVNSLPLPCPTIPRRVA